MLVNSGGASGPPDLQDPNGILFYFMPSAALDQNGNLGIAYTTSGAVLLHLPDAEPPGD